VTFKISIAFFAGQTQQVNTYSLPYAGGGLSLFLPVQGMADVMPQDQMLL
jgi:hypothetical protein